MEVLFVSTILEKIFELFITNFESTMKNFGIKFDEMEKQARCIYFIGEAIKTSNDFSEPLSNIITEVFLDLSQSIYHASQSQYRSAFQSIRSALELTMAVIYFADHPIEFIRWCRDTFDFQFTKATKEILSDEYCDALDTRIKIREDEIFILYRELSQYVHGKFSFLTVEQNGTAFQYDDEQINTFDRIYTNSFYIIIALYQYRFEAYIDNACSDYPYLKNYI
jgi:hypothetical protein